MDPSQLDEISDRYADAFCDGTGTIEGGDGTPVTLCLMTTSANCTPEYAAEWGCPIGELAVLVDWLPAGLEHTDFQSGGGFPKEKGVNPALIPSPDSWVVFPRVFEGVNVYYKRGAQAFAL